MLNFSNAFLQGCYKWLLNHCSASRTYRPSSRPMAPMNTTLALRFPSVPCNRRRYYVTACFSSAALRIFSLVYTLLLSTSSPEFHEEIHMSIPDVVECLKDSNHLFCGAAIDGLSGLGDVPGIA